MLLSRTETSCIRVGWRDVARAVEVKDQNKGLVAILIRGNLPSPKEQSVQLEYAIFCLALLLKKGLEC